MKQLKLLSVVLVLVSFISCSVEPLDADLLSNTTTTITNPDDTNSDTQVTDLLVDKWWYDGAGFTADVYFNSNGTYQQRIEFLGVSIDATGDWRWLDQDNGIMKIDNIEGQAQATSELWFRLTNITATTFNFEQSTDGVDYSAFGDPRDYQDTDPN